VSRRATGLVISGIGIAVLAVAVLADPIGVGASDEFGWRQLLAVVFGIAVVVLGYVLATGDEEPPRGDEGDT
jgi:predicted MFS family arabinose efflux permease